MYVYVWVIYEVTVVRIHITVIASLLPYLANFYCIPLP
jgi:hypothetical protein